MSHFEPQLLGYDVRLDRTVYAAQHWTPERREAFFLNQTIEWPLLVDWGAWPSYFLDRSRLHPEEWGGQVQAYVTQRAITTDNDELRYLGLRLWASLGTMLESYAKRKHDSAPGCVIAVWLEHAKPRRHQHFEVVLHPDVSPSTPAHGWPFLGYDVADQYLTSALTNLRAARERLRRSVGPRLNEHGLLSTRQDALDLEGQSDELFPAYQPFCVYGLYRIRL
jgi:hypothetical protein